MRCTECVESINLENGVYCFNCHNFIHYKCIFSDETRRNELEKAINEYWND